MNNHDLASVLFAANEPVSAELAIVFGAADNNELQLRTEHAIDLYHVGYIPRLLLTGRGKQRVNATEASRMERLALDCGVPASALLLENGSIDTSENVKFSLGVLCGHNLVTDISSVLLISSPWHMGRVLKTMRAHAPSHWKLHCCPPPGICDEFNWRTSDAHRERVMNELAIYRTLAARGDL
jgi:uncharacterized SAM-binding protein YcdF (DUF218 family)